MSIEIRRMVVKKFYLFFVLGIFTFFLIGCDFSKSTTEVQVPAPVISISERLLSWEKIEMADSYQILADNELIDTVTTAGYIIPDSYNGSEITVKAVMNDKKSVSSNVINFTIETNYVTYQSIQEIKNSSTLENDLYTLSQIYPCVKLDLSHNTNDIEDNMILLIPTGVKKLYIVGNESITIKGLNIAVLARNTDIVIILENVILQGRDESINAITLEAPQVGISGRMIIESLGIINQVKAGNIVTVPSTASSETHFFSGPASSGINGFHAGHGLMAENVIIYGNANMYFSGGVGGNGAQGSSSVGIAGSGGDGGDGGNGGDGIHCLTLTVMLEKGKTLSLAGGGAGNGGIGGTGLWGDGLKGSLGHIGTGTNGEVKRISGTVSK